MHRYELPNNMRVLQMIWLDHQLWAVSGTTNDQKSDSSHDQWKPALNDFYCIYAEAWVAVKSNYKLTITLAKKIALAGILATCWRPWSMYLTLSTTR